MSSVTPHIQRIQCYRPDASYSNVRLTRHNYSGSRLLKTIRGYTEVPDSPVHAKAADLYKMVPSEDDDIMALPLSSDEDEDDAESAQDGQTPSPDTNTKRKREDAADTSKSKKRVKQDNKPTRTSKRNIPPTSPKTEPQYGTTVHVADAFDWLSQSSQQRTGNHKKNTFARSGSSTYQSSQGASFVDPGSLPATPQKDKIASFKGLSSSPMSRKRTPNHKHKTLEIPSSTEKPAAAPSNLVIPDGSDPLLRSSSPTRPSHKGNDKSPPALSHRSRSSSLSSVDSIASYALGEEQKAQLRNGTSAETIPPGSIRCPLCPKIIESNLPTPHTDPTNLPMRKQQTLHQTHLVKDAQTTWQNNKYPTIDWPRLEKRRIPKHLAHLRAITYRKTPSFYLSNLETHLRETRGSKAKIRAYLANDIIEVVKPGYYGPKGAKVMGNAITTEMSNHLKRGLKTDETIRLVGVSGFVSAVLLPELLLRLVMEDMKIRGEEGGRRVVSESTEVGMLLWPDDDHVVLEEDGGDDDV